ncbi:trypsin-like peptidase domain-containing protein [Candidatus Laterigemmans baculatus]|nr:trypsin-like peptidase domain-containing protein [Candidatus Laterigemmans baculatus]
MNQPRSIRRHGLLARACLAAVALAALSGGTPNGLAQQPVAQQPAAQPPAAAQDAVRLMRAAEQTVERAIERAAPSVVALARVRREEGGRDAAVDFNFNLPGVQRPLLEATRPEAVPTEFGSGVILSADGAILTCYHVVDDPRANDYYVWIGSDAGGAVDSARDRRGPYPARVLAGDPWTDLAVLQIEAADLPAMPMGDASELRRGSFVVSLGNPYATARDGQASASWGIVSNLQRAAPPQPTLAGELARPESLQEFGTLIQTDARLNLGSSGGALVNLQGEMVGLTTSLAAVAGYEQPAGYAIPIDPATLATIAELRSGRAPAFGFLGVEPMDLPGGRGALIRRVVPGMAADRAGIRSGDIVVGIDGQPITDAEVLFREMSRRPADAEVQLEVVSPGRAERRTLTARLGKKRLALSRPGYSQVPEPSWRGMQVDFASALPPGRLLRSGVGRNGEAAVLRVDPDSPAWRAGVRPGQLLVEAAGEAVVRPEDFYAAVAQQEGVVQLRLEQRLGVPVTVTVAAE